MDKASTFSRIKGIHLCLLAVAVAAVIGQGCPGAAPPEEEPGPNSGLTGDYIGSQECYTCHSRHHDEWILTRHAQAYDTLVALGQENNTVCLNCHTTGFGETGGFQSINITEALAEVGCEACHGPGGPHRRDVSNRALRPPKSMSSQVCGSCHNDFHHPTYDEWAASGHHGVSSSAANYFTQGRNLSACGVCHSGDYRQLAVIEQETPVSESLLAGVAPAQMNGVTCAVCHDPHANTGNAVDPELGHDLQLRYPQVTQPIATNTITGVQEASRFNGCGQCHHSRGRTWTSNDRGPHHSVQANFYVGEMPVPEGTPLLVENERTVHRFVFKQCSTCHMQHEIETGTADPVETHAGHAFHITTFAGCSTSGCHPTPESAQQDTIALQASVQARLTALTTRMGDPSTWEYSAEGGGPPTDQQANIPEQVRKVRFMYHYILSDGSLGVHNPEYTQAILTKAEALLTEVGL
ncbi:MAG: hypothetical protein AMXMBFR13_07450 [Phycisphaerae bacterium]